MCISGWAPAASTLPARASGFTLAVGYWGGRPDDLRRAATSGPRWLHSDGRASSRDQQRHIGTGSSGERILMHSQRPSPHAGRLATEFPVVIIDDHELFSTSLLLALKNSGVDASLSPVEGVSELLAWRPHEPVGLIVLDLDPGSRRPSDDRRRPGRGSAGEGMGGPHRDRQHVPDFRASGSPVLIVIAVLSIRCSGCSRGRRSRR